MAVKERHNVYNYSLIFQQMNVIKKIYKFKNEFLHHFLVILAVFDIKAPNIQRLIHTQLT